MGCDLPQGLLAATTFVASSTASSPASIPAPTANSAAAAAVAAACLNTGSAGREGAGPGPTPSRGPDGHAENGKEKDGNQQDDLICAWIQGGSEVAQQHAAAASDEMHRFLQGRPCLADEDASGRLTGPRTQQQQDWTSHSLLKAFCLHTLPVAVCWGEHDAHYVQFCRPFR